MAKKNTTQPAPETLEQALEVIATLEAENKKLSESNEELQELLNDARNASNNTGSAPEFVYKKKKYRITAGKFMYNEKVYSAADLLADEALQAELIDFKAGFIEAVED